VFFFQAEDGIRDYKVTGVQTCALPISKRHPAVVKHKTALTRDGKLLSQDVDVVMDGGAYATLSAVVLSRGTIHAAGPYECPNVRSEERRVGKEWRSRRAGEQIEKRHEK